MLRIPERIKALKQYEPGKPIEILEEELGIKGSIKLASNENPIGPSQRAVDAIKTNLSKIHYYPDSGCFFLKKKLASHFDLKEQNFIVGNGSNEIIEVLVRSFVDVDDEIIMSTPSFIVYGMISQSAGVKYHEAPLTKNFEYDVDGILERVNKKTRMIIFANPNNPTGTIINFKDLLKVLGKIDESVLVLMDEAYFEYVDSGEMPDSIKLQKIYPNLITLRTFSKIYGLAGLRIGYAITTSEITDYFNRAREPFNVNMLAQVAAIAALDDREHVSKTIKINNAGKLYLYNELARIKNISFTKSYSNFILIDLHREAKPIFKKLLNDGVIVRPMTNWGLPNHMRVTIGKEEENARFIGALRRAL